MENEEFKKQYEAETGRTCEGRLNPDITSEPITLVDGEPMPGVNPSAQAMRAALWEEDKDSVPDPLPNPHKEESWAGTAAIIFVVVLLAIITWQVLS